MVETVSVIICTRNRAEMLDQTLAAVDRVLMADGPAVELVVVDNGSSDNTAEVVKRWQQRRQGVRFLQESRPGKSHALNRGGAAATGDIMVWLDDDIHPQPGWLDGLLRPIREGRADMVQGRIRIAPHLLRPWFVSRLQDRYGQQPTTDGNTFAVGANIALRRSFYLRTQGHDVDIGAGAGGLAFGEDVLFSHHLVALGARLGYAADGVAEHHFHPSRLARRAWVQTAEGQGRSLAYIYYNWNQQSLDWCWLRLLRKRLQLAWWRLRHRPDMNPESEGISVDEWTYLERISFLSQLLVEMRKPRLYDGRDVRKQAR